MNDELTHPARILAERVLPPLFRAICRHPNDLKMEYRTLRGGTIVLTRPHDDDFPLLMGSHAKNFRSLSTIAEAIGARHGHFIRLEKLQGGRPKSDPKPVWPEIPPDPRFDTKPLERLLEQTVLAFVDRATFETAKDGASYRIIATVSGLNGAQGQLEMESALTTVLNAAAKLRGGDLRVCYICSVTPDSVEQQPATAAGRFAKEL